MRGAAVPQSSFLIVPDSDILGLTCGNIEGSLLHQYNE